MAQTTSPVAQSVQKAIEGNPEVAAKFNAFRASNDEIDVASGNWKPHLDASGQRRQAHLREHPVRAARPALLRRRRPPGAEPVAVGRPGHAPRSRAPEPRQARALLRLPRRHRAVRHGGGQGLLRRRALPQARRAGRGQLHPAQGLVRPGAVARERRRRPRRRPRAGRRARRAGRVQPRHRARQPARRHRALRAHRRLRAAGRERQRRVDGQAAARQRAGRDAPGRAAEPVGGRRHREPARRPLRRRRPQEPVPAQGRGPRARRRRPQPGRRAVREARRHRRDRASPGTCSTAAATPPASASTPAC